MTSYSWLCRLVKRNATALHTVILETNSTLFCCRTAYEQLVATWESVSFMPDRAFAEFSKVIGEA